MADMKFGYGNANNIDTAVESGTLDERDLVLMIKLSRKSDQGFVHLRAQKMQLLN